MQRFRTMHLFAGAGGGILADLLLGHQPVCAVEIDEYCQQVLSARQKDGCLPWFPIFTDVQQFDGRAWNGTVDLVSGGFPCQAFSSAARGKNVAEKDLWHEMRRVVREVCPEFVFAENVSEKAILRAEEDLEFDGYSCKWVKLSAKDLGADHIRDRYWLLAHSNNNGKLLGTFNAEAQGLPELRNGIWEAYTGEFRVVDGVASRMDRLKAVGNGQVPIVAARAFIHLMKEFVRV